jgi:hypothetical protein
MKLFPFLCFVLSIIFGSSIYRSGRLSAAVQCPVQSEPLLKATHCMLQTQMVTVSSALLQYVIDMSPCCPDVPLTREDMAQMSYWLDDADWQMVRLGLCVSTLGSTTNLQQWGARRQVLRYPCPLSVLGFLAHRPLPACRF